MTQCTMWVPMVILLGASVCMAEAPPPGPVSVPKATDRIVCLGDSITDGCTYPQIIVQALKEAGKPVPTVICSGVASDTAQQMEARLDKTVLAFRPTIVTFSAGTNDTFRGVTAAQYEQALRSIAKRVRALGGTMVLLTPCIVSPAKAADAAAQKTAAERAAAAEKVIAEFEKAVRTVAAEEGFPVAENNALMQQARKEGKEVMSDDGTHPSYVGQSLMARSILDALGCKDVPLPAEFKPQLFPGIVPEWKMRPAPMVEDEDGAKWPMMITAASIREIVPDDTWKAYKLPDAAPEPAASPADWWEQERRNGFGMLLGQTVGKGPFQGVAVIECKEARKAFINTGIGISSVWLNGVRVHDQAGAWTGFHAGKERLPVDLVAGKNVLVVEINAAQFFLSVTDKLTWEEDLR